jgi:hypothetical protein
MEYARRGAGMGGFWTRHRRAGITGLGALLMAAGLGTVTAGAQTDTVDDDDPLAMFAELMPVFSSPRCVNCHGGTNPATNLNHLGGKQDVLVDGQGDMSFETGASDECLTCHTSAPDVWRLAPKHASFVGKDTLALCRQFRSDPFSFNLHFPEGRAGFVTHLASDELIGVGFNGDGGVGRDSAFFSDISVDPPPMSRQAFLRAAQHWVTDGEAACSNKWNGTITETSMSTERVQFGPGTREVTQEGRTVVTVVESEATAEVHWKVTDFTDVPTRECATYVHGTFGADGSKLPVMLTIVLNPPTAPPAGAPVLPPGFTLPPGMELPPGFELPPGMQLPPGFELPAGMTAPTVGPFIQYTTPAEAEVSGNNHLDTRSLPGCKQTLVDEKQPYHMAGGMIQLMAPSYAQPYGDPDNDNHLVGEKITQTDNGKTTIKWDLIRDTE